MRFQEVISFVESLILCIIVGIMATYFTSEILNKGIGIALKDFSWIYLGSFIQMLASWILELMCLIILAFTTIQLCKYKD